MIIFKDGSFQTLSTYPNDNFIDLLDCFTQEQKNNVLCVIPETENPGLVEKIKTLSPLFKLVYDENGIIIDVSEAAENE